MNTVFGFDLGTTSVGYAVVKTTPGETGADGQPEQLLMTGVRAFEETRDTGKQLETKNKERRLARMVRRQLRRRKWRRKHLAQTLGDAGLLPLWREEAPQEWYSAMQGDPYALRARALEEPLEPYELGRAIYHMAQRRGFRMPFGVEAEIENADTDSEEGKARKKETGIVKKGIENLHAEMNGRTLGAYLSTRNGKERKRGRHIGRDMVRSEFDAIWAAQAGYAPQRLTDSLCERLREVIFSQRPVFWRSKTLGTCSLMPEEALCLTGSWVGQRFVMLKTLNDLEITFPEECKPTPKERQAALSELATKGSVSFGRLRKAMGLKGAKFNHEHGRKSLDGNTTEMRLAKAFGSIWETLPARERIREEIAARLWQMNYREIGKRVEIRSYESREEEQERFIQAAQADFALSHEQAATLAKLHLPAGWLRFSETAIRRMLPHLEEGKNEYEAKEAEFPGWDKFVGEARDRLPSEYKDYKEDFQNLRNPTVERTLHELRKVTNNLIRKFGKPDCIRIELARELKQPPRVRLQILRDNHQHEKKRKQAKEELTQRGMSDHNRDVEKWLLWKECDETSPYTGNKIGFEALFQRGDFQVEHIKPQARSLDNGFMNKVLCEVEINKEKGDRTPFEYYRDTGKDWDAFKQRIKKLDLPKAKTARLFTEKLAEVGSEELAERELRDTAYASVAARKFLEQLGVRVETTNGRVTSQLAYRWGLYSAAFGRNYKDRSDLRHHAMDAIAVALSTPSAVKRLSDFYGRDEEELIRKPYFPKPWRTLWQDTREWAQRMVISHKVQRKISGPLHAQSNWGYIGKDPKDANYSLYGVRKPVDAIKNLSGKGSHIPVPKLQRYIQERLDSKEPTPLGFPEPKRVRMHVKQQPSAVVTLREPKPGRGGMYADKANNHHMAIYGRNGKAEGYHLVSMLEAVQRKAAHKLVVQPWLEQDGERLPLICSLARKDIIEVTEAGKLPIEKRESRYWVVRGLGEIQVLLTTHNNAMPQNDHYGPMWGSLFGKLGARKVMVDPIGRVRRPKNHKSMK